MSKINPGMMSSAKDNWETPQKFFDKMNDEFHFQLDVAADDKNHKCATYFTKELSGLEQDWSKYLITPGGACWMNPPYGDQIVAWVKKASESNCLVVGLLPARTDTRWFHDHVYGKAEIRFIKGRLKFVGAKDGAPFPSMIAIWRPRLIQEDL